MHNVEAGFPGQSPGKLGLSNTLLLTGRLSSSKPPHVKDESPHLLLLLDQIAAPGRVTGGTLQGSVIPVPRGSAQFRQ